jgi:hypothetical protein
MDLLTKMLAFDPNDRITVPAALEHPWLSSYHDVTDEPTCPRIYDKWRMIEELETIDEFREALWNEIEDYRREVRGMSRDQDQDIRSRSSKAEKDAEHLAQSDSLPLSETTPEVNVESGGTMGVSPMASPRDSSVGKAPQQADGRPRVNSALEPHLQPSTPSDPVVKYARRSSILQPSRAGSTYASPKAPQQALPHPVSEGPGASEPGALTASNLVAFPSHGSGFIFPARSRTSSMAGGDVTRKLLRTLSTVSIHESVEGLPGGLAAIAPIGKYIVEKRAEADAPASEMPMDFGIDELGEAEDEEGDENEEAKTGEAGETGHEQDAGEGEKGDGDRNASKKGRFSFW